MEPYSSLILRNRVNLYNLNLILGRVHMRLYLDVTSLDPAESLRVVDFPNLTVLICGEGLPVAANLAQNAGWLIGLFLRARVVVLRRVRVLPSFDPLRHQRS